MRSPPRSAGMAWKIVQRREQGPFTSIADLRAVHGCGVKTFQKIQALADWTVN